MVTGATGLSAAPAMTVAYAPQDEAAAERAPVATRQEDTGQDGWLIRADRRGEMSFWIWAGIVVVVVLVFTAVMDRRRRGGWFVDIPSQAATPASWAGSGWAATIKGGLPGMVREYPWDRPPIVVNGRQVTPSALVDASWLATSRGG
jgi:hypothetical protein